VAVNWIRWLSWRAAVTVSLDGGVVNEDVGGAVVGGDETIALAALNHFTVPCAIVLSP
jgi:hypothetical protein